jgi:hypothetical protein
MKIILHDTSYNDPFLYVCRSSRSHDETTQLIQLKIKPHLHLDMGQTFFGSIFFGQVDHLQSLIYFFLLFVIKKILEDKDYLMREGMSYYR